MLGEVLDRYVKDTFRLLKEEARAAKIQHFQKSDDGEVAFQAGYLSAYHDVISTLQSQAIAFDIPLSKLELDDICPEKELLALVNRVHKE